MKWLVSIGALLGLLIIGLLMAPSFYDWNQYKQPAIEQIKTATGYDVSINGDISLALLPSPRVYAEQVRVNDPNAKGKADAPALLAFELLDVRVALMPLLSGDVSITSVNLKEPQIYVSQDAQGEYNFMTDELKSLSEGKAGGDGKPAKSQAFDVSFDTIRVYGGQVTYVTPDQAAPLKLDNIDLVANAKSLNGPFDVSGSMMNEERKLGFEAKTGEIDTALMSTSLSLRADLDGLGLQFAGVVAGGDAPEIQGETSVIIDSLADLAKSQSKGGAGGLPNAGLSLKGLLTATPEKAALKDAEIKLGDTSLVGAVEASMNPITVKAKFTGKDVLNADKWMKPSSSSSAGGAVDPAGLGAVLPKTLEIPVLGTVNVELSLPGVTVDGHVYRNVSAVLTNTEKSFAVQLSADNLPGQGRVEAQGALSYAEKSVSQKTNTAIYSDPVAAFNVKGQAQKITETLGMFMDVRDLPIVKDARVGIFDLKGSLKPSGLYLSKGTINLDDLAVSASGSWTGQKESKRSLLKATVVADSLNLDTFLNGSDKGQSTSDPLEGIKALALPFDADVDVTLNKTTIKGQAVEGARAALTIKPNTLQIQNVGFRNLAGSSFKLSGSVGDLQSLSGLDMTGALNSPDPRKLAEIFSVDSSAWPAALKSVNADVHATGDLKNMDVDASVKAMDASVNVKGKVAEPLNNLKVSNLMLKVNHPNAMKAIKSLAPDAPSYVSLNKPLSFTSKVEMDGTVTRLNDISADVAGASVAGNLAYDAGQSVPVLAGALKIGDLVLKSGSTSSAGQSSGGASGKWSSEKIDTAFLHNFQVNLNIDANSILYETWDMKNPGIKIVLQNGKLDLSGIKAGLYDGDLLANASIASSSKGGPVSFTSAGVIKDINMGALALALSGTQRIQTSGTVSLEYDVSGQGASQKAIIETLNGSSKLNGSNVIMKGFDLAGLAEALMASNKPLPRIQQILKSSTSGGETAFDTVNGSYLIQSGVVNISSMTMDGPSATIASKGNASLPRWYMDTTHTITLKNAPDVQPFDVVIKGSLSNPGNTFGSGLFDTFVRQRLQQKAVEKLPDLLGDDVSSKLQKFGILPPTQQQQQPAPANDNTPATEPASGDAAPQAAPTQEAPREITPEEAIGGLLNGLLKQ